MKIISKASDTVLSILKPFNKEVKDSRIIKYFVQLNTDEGVLLYNTLTRELVLLSDEEYRDISNNKYLAEHWFLVPQNANEKEYADVVKFISNSRRIDFKTITVYTIFPTTDCNARCFYCFELGRSRIPMSNEVALNTVQYIKKHCGNKRVKLNWFGGEPLMNSKAIDTICKGLRDEGIEYSSRMTSNGYLFNDELVKKALDLWNLKSVQITLDGTETIYNKVKAFVYKDGNPYQIVLNNIERLLDASIHVSIRMNMDLHNAEDLLLLAQQLAKRFVGRKNLYVYAHHIFKDGVPMAQQHTDEEWAVREKAMSLLENTIDKAGFASKAGLTKKIKTNHCMADCGGAVTILPDGNIGLCESYSETEFIGHLDREGFDQEMIASWKETIPEIPECIDCFYYPQCIKLKKCTNSSECYSHFCTATYRNIQRQMRNEYNSWKKGTIAEESESFTDGE